MTASVKAPSVIWKVLVPVSVPADKILFICIISHLFVLPCICFRTKQWQWKHWTVNEISSKLIIRIMEWRQCHYFGRFNWRVQGIKFTQCSSVSMLPVKMFLFFLLCWRLWVLVTSNQTFAEIIISWFNIYVLFGHSG